MTEYILLPGPENTGQLIIGDLDITVGFSTATIVDEETMQHDLVKYMIAGGQIIAEKYDASKWRVERHPHYKCSTSYYGDKAIGVRMAKKAKKAES